MEHKKVTSPQFDLVMGGFGSGKSYFIKENYKSGYTHIDAGDIFIELSKGKYYDFPSTLEDKMNEIGLALTSKAISEKANIVMEVIGNKEKEVSQLIDELTGIGYKINVQGITHDEETALKRNANRSADNISAYFTQPYHFKWMREAINNFKQGLQKNEMDDIIQLKITLENTKPKIWRRVQVEKQTTFFELHHIIQITFGWKNYHMYEFTVDGHKLGAPDDYMKNVPSTDEGVIDARDITLESLIIEPGETFSYMYDFVNSWKHITTVEKFLPKEQEKKYPTCIDGELACPPEECGGIPGFYNLLEILKDKKNIEYKDTKMWVGRNFNPEYFDKEKVNKKLSRIDKYIMDWLNC